AHKRVLLVLDDVDSTKQLEELAGGCGWFGSGSRIIITTRDKSLVDKHVRDGFILEKYKMEALNDHDSLELFCWHAFKTSNPAKNFEGLSILAVSYAKGVPLVLKLMGSNVKSWVPDDWAMILERSIRKTNARSSYETKVKAWTQGNALASAYHPLREQCNNETSEPELVTKIVEDTFSNQPVPLPMKRIIGLDTHFEMVKPLLNFESQDTVLTLEIYGQSGIGKTTFALDIYNKIKHQFEAASFLANVREKSNKGTEGLEDLQKTLLSDMGEKTQTMLENSFEESSEIKHRLAHKRVLLVLDDVDSTKQLEALAGGCDWFGSGSRIIITTRDKSLVDNDVMDGFILEKYQMEEMNFQDSLELFCWHAFNMCTIPAKNFEGLSIRSVIYAKGVPLVLKTLGSDVKGQSMDDWAIILGRCPKNSYKTKVKDHRSEDDQPSDYYHIPRMEHWIET
ncbi:TMV resistance protein N-like, partial [Trifolium medium]|nr:TMV resistance protein N-like [Trifolium medium]